jgi:hypothetical protein
MIRLGALWDAEASRKRLALALAAILLVLHWAAPSFRPLDLTPAERTPGYSQAELAAHPGNLPRLLSRNHSFEAAQPKPERNVGPPVENPKAFVQALATIETAGGRAPVEAKAGPPRPVTRAAAFSPRAPPFPQA